MNINQLGRRTLPKKDSEHSYQNSVILNALFLVGISSVQLGREYW